MSLLSVCQEAASQLGLRQPSQIVGSADLTAQILFRFANQAGKELMRFHDWQAITVEVSATTTASVVQTGVLASDFDRMIRNAEVWNRSQVLRYSGPTSQRVWQQLKALNVTGGIIGWWRILGGAMNIFPAPTAGQILAFEYISKNWARSSGGSGQSSFMADTDTSVLPEDLLVLELVWRFRQSRGFPQYAEDMATCEREKEKMAARDRGTGRLRPDANEDFAYDFDNNSWIGTITP